MNDKPKFVYPKFTVPTSVPVCFLDIWMRVYDDSLKMVDPEIAARRASAAVSGLPEELKEEISVRFKALSSVRIVEVPHERP